MEAWVTFDDMVLAVQETFEKAIEEGHSNQVAETKAAAFLAIHHDQLAHMRVSSGIVKMILKLD